MFKSLLDGVFAAAGAVAFAVLPSFVQQYTVGLSNRHDEMQRSLREGLIAPELVAFARDRADWLTDAATAIDRSDGWDRLFEFARHFDLDTARATYVVFRPALQFTLDGLYLLVLGVVFGLLISNLIAAILRAPFRARRRGVRA